MTKRRSTVLALVLLSSLTSLARAATYSSSIVTNSIVGSGGVIINTPGVGSTFTSTKGSLITLSNISALTPLAPNSIIDVGNLRFSTTATTPDSFILNYTDALTLTDGSSTNFNIVGSLTFANLQLVSGNIVGTVTNTYTSPFTLGPTTLAGKSYTVFLGTGAVNDFFTPPNSSGLNGNLGALVTTPVPLPAAFAPASLLLTSLATLTLLKKRRPTPTL